MPDLTLAEIVGRADELQKSLDAEFAAALVGVANSWDVKRARKLRDSFAVEHHARLLAVAKAALRVQADLDDAPDSPITMEAANALSVSVRPAKGGHDV